MEVNLHRIAFLRSRRGVCCRAGGAMAPVDRSRVHTSETAALSGRPLATVAVARITYPHAALRGGVCVTIGC